MIKVTAITPMTSIKEKPGHCSSTSLKTSFGVPALAVTAHALRPLRLFLSSVIWILSQDDLRLEHATLGDHRATTLGRTSETGSNGLQDLVLGNLAEAPVSAI